MTEEIRKKASNKLAKNQTKLLDSEGESSYDDEEYFSPPRSKSRGKELIDDEHSQPEDASRRRKRRGRRGRSRSKRRRSRSRRRR